MIKNSFSYGKSRNIVLVGDNSLKENNIHRKFAVNNLVFYRKKNIQLNTFLLGFNDFAMTKNSFSSGKKLLT